MKLRASFLHPVFSSFGCLMGFSRFFGVGFYDGQLMSELNMWMNATRLWNRGTITCTGLPLLCSHFCSEWYTVCALAAVVRAERRGWCWRSRGIPRNSTVIIRCSVIYSYLTCVSPPPSVPPSFSIYLSPHTEPLLRLRRDHSHSQISCMETLSDIFTCRGSPESLVNTFAPIHRLPR